MSKLGWWALRTFVVALAIPIFWLPFMALMLVMVNNWLRAAQQAKPGPKCSRYQRMPATVPDHKQLKSEERRPSSQGGSTTVIGMQVDGDEENGISISISETYCEEANTESRSKAYRDQVENVLSRAGFYRLTPKEYYAKE